MRPKALGWSAGRRGCSSPTEPTSVRMDSSYAPPTGDPLPPSPVQCLTSTRRWTGCWSRSGRPVPPAAWEPPRKELGPLMLLRLGSRDLSLPAHTSLPTDGPHWTEDGRPLWRSTGVCREVSVTLFASLLYNHSPPLITLHPHRLELMVKGYQTRSGSSACHCSCDRLSRPVQVPLTGGGCGC